ncbi:MAG: hypothetical protein HOV71_00150 [Hamadaea sp.]|nr:hypothetical protein [Hamadaea sp.]NUT02015.1 hypothetical protein [Hamadaea sp.]
MRLLDPLTSLAPAAVATGGPGAHRIDLFFTIPEFAQLGRPNLWHRWWIEGSGWHPAGGWRQRGGLWASAVSATAYTGGRIDLFGLGRSHRLYQAVGSGDLDARGEWPRTNHGRPGDRDIISAPAALALGPGSTIVGMRTVRVVEDGPDVRGVWFRVFDAPVEAFPTDVDPWRWRRQPVAGWPASRASLRAALGMASRGPGSLDLFGLSRGYQLQHTWIGQGRTHPWETFDEIGEGFLTSTPSVAVWQNHQQPDQSAMHVACCYGPLGPLPGAVSIKSWLGRHWNKQHLIYIDGSTDGRGVAGPPVLVSWGKPRLDVFFLSQANLAGAGLGITHGVSEDGRSWDFSEILPLPDLG